jgi:hypothetical protein
MGFYRGLWIPLMTISFVRTCTVSFLRETASSNYVIFQVPRASQYIIAQKNTSATMTTYAVILS